ncbi:mechanosensitive ion channel family protein [Alkalilimnicola ehrlichii]|uniref:mechanosensitive ion channel family protein n=1 Tax=Alkalilimnicola ehrlichii TaxID=351052 RepID=UPI002162AAC2|nr:mechanosensitive ion channel family protein [Alkalilimnicola ehrlichii]
MVIVIAGLVVLQTLGISIAGVLAFGGVGGIAVGFAARDLLANFFGGLTVYLDRPFSVGDWIRSPDREIEGTVERIGWRQTRIRTFDLRPLYVPNSTFNSIALENPSRMSNRRIFETIGIRYNDADKMATIVATSVRCWSGTTRSILDGS